MSELGIIIILFAVAVVILIAEIFIPSHGVLSVAGVGFLVAAVTKTYNYGGKEAGTIAVIACLIFLPVFAYLSIKVWHRTPIGRLISPPNPVLTAADAGIPLEELSALVGATGRTLSPLRPVGACQFNGKRLSCVAEMGAIEAGVAVIATGISTGTLTVVEKKT